MKIAIYSRCSTNEKKQDVQKQISILEDYAKSQNWEIHKIYFDYKSGMTQEREQWNKLLNDANKRKFNLVLFQDLSRITRQGTLQTLMILESWKDLGIKFHSYNEPYISSVGAFGDIVISIMATLNKLERDRISEKTKQALKILKEKKGIKLGRPQKAMMLRGDIISLKEKGLGATEIAKKLNISRASIYNALSPAHAMHPANN